MQKKAIVGRGQAVCLEPKSIVAEAYRTVRTAVFFGALQAIMPIIGWLSGLTFRQYIRYDHWVALGKQV